MVRDARRLTTFTLPEEKNLYRFLVPSVGNLVLFYLLVNGVADHFGACLLLLSLGPFLRRFAFVGRGALYERVLGGCVGHSRGWWCLERKKGDTTLFGQPTEPSDEPKRGLAWALSANHCEQTRQELDN